MKEKATKQQLRDLDAMCSDLTNDISETRGYIIQRAQRIAKINNIECPEFDDINTEKSTFFELYDSEDFTNHIIDVYSLMIYERILEKLGKIIKD